MNIKLKRLSVVFLFSFALIQMSNDVFAQRNDQNKSDYFNQARMENRKTGKSPTSIRFDKNNQPPKNAFFNEYRKNYNFPRENQMKAGKEIKDKSGTHQRFYQYYKDVEVLGAQYILHEKSGFVHYANGELVHITDFDVNPVLSEQEALKAALNEVGAERYMWENPGNEEFIKKEQNDNKATFRPSGVLKITTGREELTAENIRLVYRFDIYAEEPLGRYWVDVDAKTGEIVNKLSRIHNSFVPGSGKSIYNGTVPLAVEEIETDSFHLNGLLSTPLYPDVQIQTFDMHNQTNLSLATNVISTTADGVWDSVAVQAHWGAEQTFNYFYTTFGRNSIDDSGLPLFNYVHLSNNLVNAFWDGTRMKYGDGDGTNYGPLVALDIVGHELTHGVTEHSAGLIYQNESGALNESFSDIFGEVVENYADGPNNWQCGTEIGIGGSGAIRSMDNPNAFNDPDTYKGTYWYSGTWDYGGVHTNSGVQNKWFYILSNGEAGTNDFGESYNVTGIGIEAAAAIAYRNLTVYLTPYSGYKQARVGAVMAATDMYGESSAEVAAVGAAWDAVGVYADPPAQGILVWDRIVGGQDFSGTFINNYLSDAGFTTYYTSDLPATLIGYDAVFLSFGNASNISYIQFSTAEAFLIQQYLQQGGKVYLEGGDALGYDQSSNSTLHNLFGIAGVADGSTNVIDTLVGQPGSLTENMFFSSSTQVENRFIDTYTPGNGIVAFKEQPYGNVAIQNSGAAAQKTFCFSYALAGLTNETSPSTKEDLLAKIIDFFDVSPIPKAVDDDFLLTRIENISGNLFNDNGNGPDLYLDPSTTIISFGGGSLAGDLNSNAAGSSVALAGGTLTVNENGNISLVSPTELGYFSFLYKISNGSATAQAEVGITVENIAPVAECQNITVTVDNNCQVTITPADIDNGSYDPDGDPISLSIDITGVLNPGIHSVKLMVNDGYTESTCNSTVTVIDTTSPLPPAPPANVFADCAYDVPPQIDLTAIDNCNGSITVSPTDDITPGDCPNNFTIVRTWTFTDLSGNSSYVNQTIIVNDTIAPIAPTPPASVEATCAYDAPPQIDLTAVDNCSGSITVNPTDEVTSWECKNKFTMIRTWTFVDDCGNQSSVSQTIVVNDTHAPVISGCPPADFQIASTDDGQCYYTASGNEFDVSAIDNCSGQVSLTYELSGATVSSGTVSLSGEHFNAGSTTVTWTASDECGNSSTCSFDVVVNSVQTTTTVSVNPVSQQYSDLVEFQANVTPWGCGGTETTGDVTFYVGTQAMGTVNIDANGTATASYSLAEIPGYPSNGQMSPGIKTVTAEFNNTNSAYVVQDAETTLTITPEDANIEYNGIEFQATDGSNSAEATVALRAILQSNPDGTGLGGDIRNACVTIEVNSSIIVGGLNPELINPSDLTTGIVEFPWTFDIGSADYESFDVKITADCYFSGVDQTVVTVYKPVGDFITGGGHIKPTLSAGMYASTPGLKTNFGFHVKWNKTGKNLQGGMNILFRQQVGEEVQIFQIKTNSMTTLGVNTANPDEQIGEFESKATLQNLTTEESLGGNLTLHSKIIDRGNPGSNDEIAITLWNRNTLLYSSEWNGLNTDLQYIETGNIVVHAGFELKSAAIAEIAPIIGEEPQFFDVELYPNPSTGKVNLYIHSPEIMDSEVTLRSVTGSEIFRKKYKAAEKIHLDLTNQMSGIYFVSFTQGDNSAIKKLVLH
ncbi:M4 family metallopeptidase [Maribellus comscasis]|uniref:M4 family metallopeptidase n=1 Tax=Maribellus comscasis TaxID=2681766 RepID=UPI00131CAC2B|nr:M4 family metallopeptidase [Maribellus comscasis]